MCKKEDANADYWQRVVRTGYIILVYISSVSIHVNSNPVKNHIPTGFTFHSLQGIVEAIKGPTMLDLAHFFGTSVSVISFMFVCFVAGSAIGSLACKLNNS